MGKMVFCYRQYQNKYPDRPKLENDLQVTLKILRGSKKQNATFPIKDEIKFTFDVGSRSDAKILSSHTNFQGSALSILAGTVAQGSFDRQTTMMTFLKCFPAHSRPAGHTGSRRLYLGCLTHQHVLLLCIGRSKCWLNISGCQ